MQSLNWATHGCFVFIERTLDKRVGGKGHITTTDSDYSRTKRLTKPMAPAATHAKASSFLSL